METHQRKWYANKIGKKISEFDEYDLHICKVLEAYIKDIWAFRIANQKECPTEFIEIVNDNFWDLI